MIFIYTTLILLAIGFYGLAMYFIIDKPRYTLPIGIPSLVFCVFVVAYIFYIFTERNDAEKIASLKQKQERLANLEMEVDNELSKYETTEYELNVYVKKDRLNFNSRGEGTWGGDSRSLQINGIDSLGLDKDYELITTIQGLGFAICGWSEWVNLQDTINFIKHNHNGFVKKHESFVYKCVKLNK